MSDAWLPIFSSFFETAKPGSAVGTRKNEQPCAPASGSVLASSVTKSARVPLVMKVFWPLMHVVVAVAPRDRADARRRRSRRPAPRRRAPRSCRRAGPA